MAHKDSGHDSSDGTSLPREPIHALTAPIERFLHVEAASGVVLLVAALVALVLANSPAAASFAELWKIPLGFRLGGVELQHSLRHWVNDALMAVFFFVVGLEVKRELVMGELRDLRRAALPIAAAIGGMVAPAAVYLILQGGQPAARGWGISMATDIAFVVGVLAVLGPRIPSSLRALLLSLAIADDIGAIAVIAIGYTATIHWLPLLGAVAGLGGVLVLQALGVRSVPVYVVVGALVWLGVHESGVHATIAGVLLGLLTPTEPWVPHGLAADLIERAGKVLSGEGMASRRARRAVRRVETAAREALSPLERLENALHPWSSFAIMPLFALANAGVPVDPKGLSDPVAIAVAAGLVLGKPVGILAASFVAVRLGLAKLPQGITWPVMAGAGLLAGIGFTMALFIAGLALSGPVLDAAKVGILGGSLVAGLAGALLLRGLLPLPAERSA